MAQVERALGSGLKLLSYVHVAESEISHITSLDSVPPLGDVKLHEQTLKSAFQNLRLSNSLSMKRFSELGTLKTIIYSISMIDQRGTKYK